MWPILPGLIAGGASLLGNIFSSNTSAQNTQAQIASQQQLQAGTEQFNSAEAAKQRDFSSIEAAANRNWQDQMSSTALQRGRADAIKAGINPMALAGMGGASSGGGATASGSTASVSTPSAPMPQNTSPLAGIGDAVSKVVNTAISAKTFEKMTEEIANIRADSARLAASTGLTKEQEKTQVQQTEKTAAEGMLRKYEIPTARVSAKESAAKADIPQSVFDLANQSGYLAEKGGKVADMIGSLISSAGGFKRMMPVPPKGLERSTTRKTSGKYGDTTHSWEENVWYPAGQ